MLIFVLFLEILFRTNDPGSRKLISDQCIMADLDTILNVALAGAAVALAYLYLFKKEQAPPPQPPKPAVPPPQPRDFTLKACCILHASSLGAHLILSLV